MGQIYWTSDRRGGLTANIPGLFLHVASSQARHACSKRFGWSIYDHAGKTVASCNPMRWSRKQLAVKDCARHLQEHHPAALQEALHG